MLVVLVGALMAKSCGVWARTPDRRDQPALFANICKCASLLFFPLLPLSLATAPTRKVNGSLKRAFETACVMFGGWGHLLSSSIISCHNTLELTSVLLPFAFYREYWRRTFSALWFSCFKQFCSVFLLFPARYQ